MSQKTYIKNPNTVSIFANFMCESSNLKMNSEASLADIERASLAVVKVIYGVQLHGTVIECLLGKDNTNKFLASFLVGFDILALIEFANDKFALQDCCYSPELNGKRFSDLFLPERSKILKSKFNRLDITTRDLSDAKEFIDYLGVDTTGFPCNAVIK